MPQPKYFRSNDLADAITKLKHFVKKHNYPVVVKAAGLAAGKGVEICHDEAQAIAALTDRLVGGKFKEAGLEIVVEQFIKGKEVSVHVLTDGTDFLMLPIARDFKALFPGGPNTGGTGAIAPIYLDPVLMSIIENKILKPTLQAMAKEGRPFRGLLYLGAIITDEGEVFVLEFNCRFGDPETQAIMPLLSHDDLVDLLWATTNSGELSKLKLAGNTLRSATLAKMTQGYPDGKLDTDHEITGLEDVKWPVTIEYAGVGLTENGKLKNTGGRVLYTTSVGASFTSALNFAYEAIEKIDWPGAYHRPDIGAEYRQN